MLNEIIFDPDEEQQQRQQQQEAGEESDLARGLLSDA